MKISKYKESDFEGCMNVFESNMPRYFAEWERDEYASYLSKHASTEPYFVCKNDCSIVGCGGYFFDGNWAGLSWGMVLNDSHGQGIGSALLQHRLECLQQSRNNIQVRIDTSQHTQGFYEHHGFKMVGKVENGYTQGLHKIFMEYRAKS
jgi:GNAT superfamily N-acetyltransferase